MTPAARKKKTPTHSKTTKRKNDKRASSVHRELTTIVLLALSLYSLTCVLFTEGMGALGEIVRNTLLGLFGPIGAVAIPAVLAVLFFFARVLRKNGVIKTKLFCSVAAVLSVISALHLILEGVPQASNAVDIVSDLWINAKEGVGGGLIGGLIALGSAKAVGRVVAIMLLLLITAVSLSFAVGFSACGIWTAIANLLCLEREPREPKPKKAKKQKEKKAKPAKPDPAEELSALLSHAGERSDYGSANADVVDYDGYEDVNSSHGADYDVSYEEEKEELADDEDGYDEDDKTGYYTENYPDDDGYDNKYDDEYGEEYGGENRDPDDGKYTDDEYADDTENGDGEESPTAFRYSDEPDRATDGNGEEDNTDEDIGDDADDTDPFEPTPVISKTRRFGKLMGRLSTAQADKDEAIAPVKDEEETPEEDDGTLKWETGKKYVYPHIDLLKPAPERDGVSDEEAQTVADKILHKLKTMKVNASIRRYVIGPTFTRYELIPGEGVRVDAITNLVKDITLELAAGELRIEAPIPGTPAIGIEVPNKKVTMVPFRSLVESPVFAKAKSKITVCLGKSVTGDVVVMDIDDMPHALVAGQTKSGKSVAMNCMLLSLLYRVTPDEVKLLLIDPKCVEFNIYKKIPHLVMPVIKEPTQAAAALSWAADEMDRRYKLMEDHNARNREEYLRVTANKPDREVFPQMIVVIDEYADLVIKARELRNSIEDSVSRLGGKARACGIHLLIGTQRPSADVITGIIKSNIPARISFKVAGSTEVSIIGTKGADKLLGKGDLLYLPTGGALVRAQGAFVDASEITDVINYVIENNGEASFDPEILEQLKEKEQTVMPVKKRGGGGGEDDDFPKNKKEDPLLLDAIDIAVAQQKISTSSLQRHLGVGYSRGAKLIDAMEDMGIVEPQNGSKPRRVLMTMEDFMRWKREQDIY